MNGEVGTDLHDVNLVQIHGFLNAAKQSSKLAGARGWVNIVEYLGRTLGNISIDVLREKQTMTKRKEDKMNWIENISDHDKRQKQKMWVNRALGFIAGLIAFTILFVLFGCEQTAPQRAIDPIVVKLEIQGVDAVQVSEQGDKVMRSMEVPSESGELSGLTFIEGDIGYMKIWGGLSSADAFFIWNDLCLLRLRGIKKVELYINSGGGSAFDGLSISDQIERFVRNGGYINAFASGVIASATVPILAVCSHRSAAPGTIFMVHEASMFKYFANETKSDIESQQKLMELLEDNYLNKLAKYTDISVDEWGKYIKETRWFSVQEALEFGLVDEVE